MATTSKKTTNHKKRHSKAAEPVVIIGSGTEKLPAKAEPVNDLNELEKADQLPKPITPKVEEPKIERQAPVLVRQTYNDQRVRRLALVLGVVLVVALSGLLWANWGKVARTVSPQSFLTSEPIQQLSVDATDIDEAKKLQALEDANLQATASAAPNSGSSQVAPLYTGELGVLATNELYDQLAVRVAQLQSHGVDVIVWQQYTAQAQASQRQGNEEGARTILMEAIQSAKERQALFAYYGK